MGLQHTNLGWSTIQPVTVSNQPVSLRSFSWSRLSLFHMISHPPEGYPGFVHITVVTGTPREKGKKCRVSLGLSSKPEQHHFYHILLAKASHKTSPDSRDGKLGPFFNLLQPFSYLLTPTPQGNPYNTVFTLRLRPWENYDSVKCVLQPHPHTNPLFNASPLSPTLRHSPPSRLNQKRIW